MLHPKYFFLLAPWVGLASWGGKGIFRCYCMKYDGDHMMFFDQRVPISELRNKLLLDCLCYISKDTPNEVKELKVNGRYFKLTLGDVLREKGLVFTIPDLERVACVRPGGMQDDLELTQEKRMTKAILNDRVLWPTQEGAVHVEVCLKGHGMDFFTLEKLKAHVGFVKPRPKPKQKPKQKPKPTSNSYVYLWSGG